LLRHVVDSGVTFPGIADVYGPHSNEQLIREAFHRYPEDLVIATKGVSYAADTTAQLPG
jgi:aryl-alcohol dehydrogenase-like predicted oxidoreductase